MSSEPKWHFPPYLDGQVRQDPTQSEFFTTESTGSLTASLVRETIQNSLDARADKKRQVGVRFSFVTVQPQDYKCYLEGLMPHLRETLADRDLPTFTQPMRFLVVEDFKTKGLTGDPEARDSDPSQENHFYYFWRNVGRSGKTGDKRGRWGLGKSVFYTISDLNTFFGITNPTDRQGVLLLMGQAVLKSHRVNRQGDELTPYGYYAIFDDGSHFALPITDREQTERFCRVFQLLRWHPQKEIEPGLSVAVPQPREDIKPVEIIRAAIDQYFYPILNGTLHVRVKDPETRVTVSLKEDEIQAQLGRIPGLSDEERSRYERLFDFTRWALQLADEDYIDLRPAPLDRAPTWNYDYLDADMMAAAAQRFAETGRIAFRVPVKVQRKKAKPEQARFKVFLERDETLKRAENHFIREGITIVGIDTLKQPRLRGMVVVDQEPLTTMLGDAENPAHTDWSKDSRKFKDKYEHGSSTISFVKNSLKELARHLTEVKVEIDKDLLRDIFSLPTDETAPRGKRQKPQPHPHGEQQVPDSGGSPEINGHPPPVRIEPSGTGVLIVGNDLDGATPQRVTAEFAYDVRTGDPFRRHTAADFDLRDSQIAVDARGAQVEAREINRLTLRVQQPGFRVYVSGFHPYRDLKVRLRWDDAGEAESP